MDDDGEANLVAPLPAAAAAPPAAPPPPPPAAAAVEPKNNPGRSINPDSNFSTSSSSSSSSSPPDFLRRVQAAFKRHRPLVTMQPNNIRPRRLLVPQRDSSKSSGLNVVSTADNKRTHDEVPLVYKVRDSIALAKNKVSNVKGAQGDAAMTPPSLAGSINNASEERSRPFDVEGNQSRSSAAYQHNETLSSSLVESEHVQYVDGQKKVQFSAENNARTQGADNLMATGTDNLLSHMDSLALTEMEWDASNQVEASTAISHDSKLQTFQNVEMDVSLRSEGGITSILAKRGTGVQDQLHQFSNFVRSDLSLPMTQSSVVGSSCATTTLVNSTSAPMISSTTYCPHPQQGSNFHVGVESSVDPDMKIQPSSQHNILQPLSESKYPTDQVAMAAQASSSAVGSQLLLKEENLSKGQQGIELREIDIPKAPLPLDDRSTKGKGSMGDVTDVQSEAPLSKDPASDAKLDSAKSGKQEKAASNKAPSAPRKKGYDPDLFFKVNGKLYQRLGKIGSGGSSEVHKVISSDCTIYALKKIKLKGRDYATAYGFCQEIEYLNKLKGKNYIIQLIDYEVTDKNLLREVISGSMSNKDSRVKEDGYIYMVLEYGEIDLAHMLSQKWKELDDSQLTIDENWLRFYWQQILLAVNTIHEERVVHSDLKPANFLLVRGSLKLIDFGIAKAIMSDTTNIQRDSQVGTLSYMSPEAFMCNETDANGNIIKCGRPSDIWSLGCILYQMVYGRTPFADYKTFWAKFKVITDPNHEITYEPLSNPWLLDLMKKCLAWDRNERWRIPQLLQHPFLVPPIPPQISSSQEQNFTLLHMIAESCANDPKALMLCLKLQRILRNPGPAITSSLSISPDQQLKLLGDMSNLCFQLREQLANSEIS